MYRLRHRIPSAYSSGPATQRERTRRGHPAPETSRARNRRATPSRDGRETPTEHAARWQGTRPRTARRCTDAFGRREGCGEAPSPGRTAHRAVPCRPAPRAAHQQSRGAIRRRLRWHNTPAAPAPAAPPPHGLAVRARLPTAAPHRQRRPHIRASRLRPSGSQLRRQSTTWSARASTAALGRAPAPAWTGCFLLRG